MIDFAGTVLSAPGWFYVIIFGSILIAYLAGGIRSVTAPSAWAMLVLFYVWVLASNSWQFIERPDRALFDRPEGLETAWRLYTVYIYETLILAYLAATAVTFGVLSWIVWGAYTGRVRLTLLTAMYAFTNFVAQAGDVMQRYVCKANDPSMGFEYLEYAHGIQLEGCGRLFVRMFHFLGDYAEPFAGNIGPLFFPILTVIPMMIVLWWTRKRLR